MSVCTRWYCEMFHQQNAKSRHIGNLTWIEHFVPSAGCKTKTDGIFEQGSEDLVCQNVLLVFVALNGPTCTWALYSGISAKSRQKNEIFISFDKWNWSILLSQPAIMIFYHLSHNFLSFKFLRSANLHNYYWEMITDMCLLLSLGLRPIMDRQFVNDSQIPELNMALQDQTEYYEDDLSAWPGKGIGTLDN